VTCAPAPAGVILEPAQAADFEDLLALRMRAMRESLERIGRFDAARARERLAEGFDPAHTQHIVANGRRVGFMVLKTLSHSLWLKHLYIDPPSQGRGIGAQVLAGVIARSEAAQLPIEVAAIKRSDAHRFYQRHGFHAVAEGEWDIEYVRLPTWPSVKAVRTLWAAFEARDWKRARALLRDDLQATWWTSGERFTSADGFMRAQVDYPEGWTLRLIECERLEDGRVLSVVRVDHPPRHFYGTSIARLDDGRIVAIDEYWATTEAPPAWRDDLDAAGRERFDALDDARAAAP
jgi:GNAT superfamily N-acetyltransferase